jgi:hypothetical protein
MQRLAASSRRSVAFGFIFTVSLIILSFLAVLYATKVKAQSSGCPGAENVATFDGTQDQTTEPLRITGDSFRLAFDIQGSGRLDVAVLDRFQVSGDDTEISNLGPGTFRLEIQEGNRDVSRYEVDVDDCRGERDDNIQGTTNQQTTSQNQQTTTAQDTTDTTATDANPNADANLNTDLNRPDAENFRCDLFLRAVRDENGLLFRQYRDGDREDELIVQRFEQCLAGDVLADTIPDRTLPFTGGMPLPFGGGLLLLVAAAVLAGRIIRR